MYLVPPVVPLALMTRGALIPLPHMDPSSNGRLRTTTIFRGGRACENSLDNVQSPFQDRVSLFAIPGVEIAMNQGLDGIAKSPNKDGSIAWSS